MLRQTAIAQPTSRPYSLGEIAKRPPSKSFPLADPLELMGARMIFARNEEIYGEDEPADYLYKVVTGTARTCKILSDGRRQIGAFHLPGDVFGLEVGETHSCSAEAVTATTILVIKRTALTARAARDNELASHLWMLTAREVERLQGHLLLLIKTAHERVAAFILEMAERTRDHSAVDLSMSRQDIADYLGLTIETVSRTLTHFVEEAVIELPSSRRIVLRNRSALKQLTALGN